MSLEDLLRHTAEIWRPTETSGDDAEVVNDWDLVTDPVGFNAEPYVLDRTLRDRGPGEQLVGERKWTLRKDATVRKFDVLRIIAGNNAPARFRVLDVYVAGQGSVHHYECRTEPWEGLLPVDVVVEEESS